MSSAISAEQNTMGSRAKLVLTVFSCIGLGVFGSGFPLTQTVQELHVRITARTQTQKL